MPMTMPAHVTLIFCSQCPVEVPSSYRVQPDRHFRCLACGHVLDVRDLVLDPEEVWTVSRDGLLGYAVDWPQEVAEALEDAFAAVHRGASLLDRLSLSEGEAAAVNLAVCAVLTALEDPTATLDDVTRSCFESSLPQVAARHGWRVRSEAAGPVCPVCGGAVVPTCRGWQACASSGCSWGDMAAAAPGWEL
ncbi:hypothetical protein [Streptomyces vinaceus]|uniref:hypothetical protein n=1 Tax=Streptomyces vinaceus TaxID=1960 RepID=UPI003827146A